MILVTGTVRLADGARDATVEALGPMIEDARREPGCHACRYSFDVTDPQVLHFHEEWESEDALQAHFRSPGLAAFGAATGDLFDGRPAMTMWRGEETSMHPSDRHH